MNTERYSLGIDLGTTSVKVCLVRCEDFSVVRTATIPTLATIPSDIAGGSEQDALKVMDKVKQCLCQIPKEERECVKYIGVTGQMHGAVLWSDNITQQYNIFTPESRCETETKQSQNLDVKNKTQTSQSRDSTCTQENKTQTSQSRDSTSTQGGEQIEFSQDANSSDVGGKKIKTYPVASPLYTWQDQRCSSEFLSSLPTPDSHLPLATGHGCATLFWLLKYQPDYLNNFNMTGTIMDMFVWLLGCLHHPVTSDQLAASMGYFNSRTKSWNTDILKKVGFPVDILPFIEIKKEAGKLMDEYLNIKQGTPVMCAVGDVQCAAISVIQNTHDAVLNMSTSCQLMFPMMQQNTNTTPATVQYFPYFDGQYLAMAASLNGGNVISSFVDMLKRWMSNFNVYLTEDDIWKVLQQQSDASNTTGPDIIPTLFGERHCPDQPLSVTSTSITNFDLGSVFTSLCRGLVQNIHSMMSKTFLKENGIKRLITTGSVLERVKVIQHIVEETFNDLEIHHGDLSDSAIGAARHATS